MTQTNRSKIAIQLLPVAIFIILYVVARERIVEACLLFIIVSASVFGYFQEDRKKSLLNLFLLSVACSALSYRVDLPLIKITAPALSIIIIFLTYIYLNLLNFKFDKFFLNEKILLLFTAVYISGGAINIYYIRTGITQWVDACILPAIILYMCFIFISTYEQTNKALVIASISVLGFLIITFIANLMGYAHPIESQVELGQLATEVEMGKIKYSAWATWLGASIAIIFPSILLYTLTVVKAKQLLICLAIITILLFLVQLIATRGATLSIGASLIVIFLLGLYKLRQLDKFVNRLVGVCCLIGVSLWLIYSFTDVHSVAFERLSDLAENQADASTIVYRSMLLYGAYASLADDPVGIGFDKLWDDYEIDEANFFSWSSHGVGLVGVIGFWAMWFMLAGRFISGLFNRDVNARYYAVIGITTQIAAFIAANSSNQILHEPQTALPFWLIMGTAFKATYIPSIEKKFVEVG